VSTPTFDIVHVSVTVSPSTVVYGSAVEHPPAALLFEIRVSVTSTGTALLRPCCPDGAAVGRAALGYPSVGSSMVTFSVRVSTSPSLPSVWTIDGSMSDTSASSRFTVYGSASLAAA